MPLSCAPSTILALREGASLIGVVVLSLPAVLLLSSAGSSDCLVLLNFHHERPDSGLLYYHIFLCGGGARARFFFSFFHIPFWRPRRNARTVHDYLCCHETLTATTLFIFSSLLITGNNARRCRCSSNSAKKGGHISDALFTF